LARACWCSVSRRTREIGIRVALGADRRRIVAPIFLGPLRQVGLGVTVGVGLLVLLLFADAGGLSWRITGVALAFALVMFGICMLACIGPTRRALRIEPTEALRMEG
jgi:ABC-type antimicrobial peptide transport system permease subunit